MNWIKSILALMLLIILQSCEKEAMDNYVTDIDGNKYKTIQIGTLTWMAENLKVMNDKNGNPLVSYCYSERTDRCEEFGRLYTWEEAKKSCPEGWRLPTTEDWQILEIELGMDMEDAEAFGWRGTNQGIQLKEGGSSGFNALLAGYKDGTVLWDGRYFDIGYFGGFWSATEYDELNAVAYLVYVTSEKVNKQKYDKTAAFSVRCVKEN